MRQKNGSLFERFLSAFFSKSLVLDSCLPVANQDDDHQGDEEDQSCRRGTNNQRQLLLDAGLVLGWSGTQKKENKLSKASAERITEREDQEGSERSFSPTPCSVQYF